jgi:hypothetical protein
MPGVMAYFTADEAAETLDYWPHLTEQEGNDLSRKLWQFLAEAKNPTPLGGDGTNGTVETPEERLSLRNDDKGSHWWDRLTEREQIALAKAVEF